MHLNQEPASLKPYLIKKTTHSSLHYSLHRSLLKYNSKNELVPDLAESCKQLDALSVKCRLKKNLTWNDGTTLKAEDFLRTYKEILDPKNLAPHPEHLFPIKNAIQLYNSKDKKPEIGITAINEKDIMFHLETPNSDFIHHLANISMAPYKEGLSSGPYQLKEWVKGKKILLSSNLHYHQPNKKRPQVQIIFISNDSAALHLYQKGNLDILRRLPTSYMPAFQKSPEFHWQKLIRMDYVGLSPELAQDKQLSQALTENLDFKAMQKLFHSPDLPGCPGIPNVWLTGVKPCYQMKTKTVPLKIHQEIPFYFSQRGGEDHERFTSWLYYQWKTNLDLSIKISGLEHETFLKQVTRSGRYLYRKGIAPEILTCSGVLSEFKEISEPTASFYQKIIQESDISRKKEICTQAISLLMSEHRIIPTGEVSYADLIKPRWTGWEMNGLHQLDLSLLRPNSN